MCSFVGFTNLKHDISNKKDIIIDMAKALTMSVPDEEHFYFNNHINLGYRNPIIINFKTDHQPMSITHNENTYTIVYNGQLYNSAELIQELVDNGCEFKNYSDTEVILKAYLLWGNIFLKKLNGTFSLAIWNENKQELFLARDHFGIKPLYYTLIEDNLIFSSELKALIKHPLVELKLDKNGISELLGLRSCSYPRKYCI